MQTKVIAGDITSIEADAIVVNLFEGVEHPGGATGAVDKALDGTITALIANGEIKGKLNQINIIHSLGKLPARIVAVAGLGKQPEFTLDRIRSVSAEFCRALRKLSCRRIATIVHGGGIGGIEPELAAQAINEGCILGLYKFRKHVTKEPEEQDVEELLIVERDATKLPALEQGCLKGRIIAEATNLARDWTNEPANYMTPSDMARVAQELAKAYNLDLTILDRDQIEREGMGAFLGVAQGSRQPPKFIVLSYRGNPTSPKALGFVGKAITFDSGGLDIKSTEAMADMKGDMAGGAAVLSALAAIAQLKPKVNITAIVAATENLPGGTALKPGDILKAINGKTIEVVNTDAEGRLTLADALGYAVKQGFSPLIDVATLTGACHIALGDICSGIFGNSQELIDKVIKAGADAGERLWQMPMHEEYKELNKSDIADIKNSGGRWGGAITAAQFLSEFAGDTPWVHIDIAGTARNDKERGYSVKGATGVSVRTLVNLALASAEPE
ncbi:MAG TPA: leucyl aminopeptidase [Dehalococcoidia bacterium]|nr:leucyl aminopeptidase [Dehalococcoidia bacterium]